MARKLPSGTFRRILVTPTTTGFGLGRMFQLAGEPKTSEMEVVRTMNEALAALGVQLSHFEPLEFPSVPHNRPEGGSDSRQ